MTFWLYDSRHRGSAKHAKRVLRIYPETPRGRIAAWQHVLRNEVQAHEWEQYEMYYDPADWDEYPDAGKEWSRQSCESFNEFWSEYGWYMIGMGDDEPMPKDVELQE